MKKFIYLIISLINTGITALCLYLSPYEILPIHYGINGYADRYSSKWEIMIAAAIPVVFGIIYLVYSIIAEKKGNKSRKVTDKVFLIAYIYIICYMVCNNTMLAVQGTNEQFILCSPRCHYGRNVFGFQQFYAESKTKHYVRHKNKIHAEQPDCLEQNTPTCRNPWRYRQYSFHNLRNYRYCI